MSYLKIARSALLSRERSEQSSPQQPSQPSERSSDGEISERSEKRPGLEPDSSTLTLEAERLKSHIIAVVTVDPAEFDRELYDVLTAEWLAYEATLARNDAGLKEA
jgi:hypothetical protein